MKNRVIALICIVAMLLSVMAFSSSAADATWIEKNAPEGVEYSFAVVGDIQTLTDRDNKSDTNYLPSIFNWILKNKDTRKIEYVFGLGDSIETLSTWPEAGYKPSVNTPAEWSLASAQFARLNGVIPYLVVRGNHDDEAGYHKYICTDDYKNQMDGFYYDPSKPALDGNSMSNSYRKISVGGEKYLMLALDYDTNNGAIAWANEVIASNPDYKVIVSMHTYLHKNGDLYHGAVGQPGANDQTDGDPIQDYVYFSGTYFWESVFSKYENVLMILCGHFELTDPVVQTREGIHGNEVIEILVNPQAYDERDPSGFVMMLNFMEGGEEIQVEYISTIKNKHFKESNQHTLNIEKRTAPAGGILLSKYATSIALGESTTLTATLGTGVSGGVSWTSSDPSVVSVEGGTLRALAQGSATITARASNGATAVCEVRSVVKAQGITISDTTKTVTLGGTASLSAEVFPEIADNQTVIWETSKKNIVVVTADGTLIPKAKGTATITASTTNGHSVTCEVNVIVEAKSVTLNNTSAALKFGESITLTAKVSPTTTNDKTITWTTSDPGVATVSDAGEVRAVGIGTATVTATTVNGISATCEVSVFSITDSVSFDKSTLEMIPGENATLTATVLPANSENKTLTWTSSDESVVSVEDGVLTAKALGTATITATTVDGRVASCTVTVSEKIVEPPVSDDDNTTTDTEKSGCNSFISAQIGVVFGAIALGALSLKHRKED